MRQEISRLQDFFKSDQIRRASLHEIFFQLLLDCPSQVGVVLRHSQLGQRRLKMTGAPCVVVEKLHVGKSAER